MELAGNCNLVLPEFLPKMIRCREAEACAICGLCLSHCLQHFQMPDGMVHGKTFAPIPVDGDRVVSLIGKAA